MEQVARLHGRPGEVFLHGLQDGVTPFAGDAGLGGKILGEKCKNDEGDDAPVKQVKHAAKVGWVR